MQILVIVAIIQVRFLKTEVENGFVEREIRYKWLDPKNGRNWFKVELLPCVRKGMRLIFLKLDIEFYGNIDNPRDLSLHS